LEACEKGRLTGHKVTGVRYILQDGQAHFVDSSDLAFRLASAGAFREAFSKANPIVLEPIMNVQITAPQEFQSAVLTQLNRRKGVINDSEVQDDYVSITAEVSLSQMFGYVSDLRSATQEEMVKAYQKQQESRNK
jgi:elongation factor G